MELYHLKTFLAVAELGHLTQAAERRCISQPAVSAHVKALEAELGLTLFDRTPRGMVLTADGIALCDPARAVLEAVDALGREAAARREEVAGVVRIGLNTDAGFLRLAELQAAIQARYPQLSLEFLGGTTGSNLPKLRQGRLDACFMSGPAAAAEFDSRLLREEEMAIAVPRAWTARLADGGPEALLAEPWIYTSPDRIQHEVMTALFAAFDRLPPRAALANQKDAVLALVAAGTGLAITRRKDIDAAATERPIDCLPLPDATPTVSLRFAWLARRRGERALQAVVSVLDQVWSDTP